VRVKSDLHIQPTIPTPLLAADVMLVAPVATFSCVA